MAQKTVVLFHRWENLIWFFSAMLAARMAILVCRLVSWLVGPSLWFRLKYLFNYWVDHHDILNIHSTQRMKPIDLVIPWLYPLDTMNVCATLYGNPSNLMMVDGQLKKLVPIGCTFFLLQLKWGYLRVKPMELPTALKWPCRLLLSIASLWLLA